MNPTTRPDDNETKTIELIDTVPVVKEKDVDAAHRGEIAKELLAIFKLILLAEVGGCFLFITTCLILIAFRLLEATTAVQLIKDGVVPLFTSASNLATAVFGQLLAFVLGFYFGGKAKGI